AAVTVAIQSAINTAIGWIHSAWTTATTWISDKWNQLTRLAKATWAAVSVIFSSIWSTYISGPLNSFWNSVTNWWQNTVVGVASNLGTQLIQGIANGISGAAGVVGNAIHGAISTGLSDLGFHGIPGFASGVENFQPPQGANSGLAWIGEHGPELV